MNRREEATKATVKAAGESGQDQRAKDVVPEKQEEDHRLEKAIIAFTMLNAR